MILNKSFLLLYIIMSTCDETNDHHTKLLADIQQKITDSGNTDTTSLTQADFTKPYVISKPGKYILHEDIKINFYPAPYDIFDVQSTGNDLFGFPAAIKITAEGVDLDLNHKTLYQSPQDFCVQRFFALIQLNNTPFAIDAGPIPKSYTTLQSASYVHIHNGELGLTSHQCILGNDNKNILIQDVSMCDFEVTAVTLNNAQQVYFDNVWIKRSIGINRLLPVSAYWSSLIFNYRLLKLAFVKFYITTCEQNLIINTNNHIRNSLTPFLDVIYGNRTLTCIYRKCEYLANKVMPYLRFLFNPSKVSPCGVHGIKITGPNPSVTVFHQAIDDDPEKRKSTNITLSKCTIEKLIAHIDPTICVTYDKKPVHIGAGLKLTADLLCVPLIQDIVRTMNILGKNPTLNGFIKTTVNDDIQAFVMEKTNCSGRVGFDGAMDMMGHLNKGVMALRLGSNCVVDISQCHINDIRNEGTKLDMCAANCLLAQYNVKQIDFTDDTFLSPMNYHGSYAMGAILSGSEKIQIQDCSINEIVAPHGAAVGLAINNECVDISMNGLNIWNLTSCNTCFDSATFVIDEASKNITIHGDGMKLNPNSSAIHS